MWASFVFWQEAKRYALDLKTGYGGNFYQLKVFIHCLETFIITWSCHSCQLVHVCKEKSQFISHSHFLKNHPFMLKIYIIWIGNLKYYWACKAFIEIFTFIVLYLMTMEVYDFLRLSTNKWKFENLPFV